MVLSELDAEWIIECVVDLLEHGVDPMPFQKEAARKGKAAMKRFDSYPDYIRFAMNRIWDASHNRPRPTTTPRNRRQLWTGPTTDGSSGRTWRPC